MQVDPSALVWSCCDSNFLERAHVGLKHVASSMTQIAMTSFGLAIVLSSFI